MGLFTFETDVNLIRIIDLIKKIENNNMTVKGGTTIITPYYIDRKRYELYHYELFIGKGIRFEDFLLKKTGKKTLEEVPKHIAELRKKYFICFDEPDTDITSQIIDYLKMLLNDKNLEEEIKEVFDSYDNRNLFVEIY